MTSATEPHPVSVNGAELAAHAAETSTSLRRLIEDRGLTSAEDAATVLNLSPAGLLDAMAAGCLDGVIVDGRVHVVAEQVQLRALDEMRRGAARAVELRTQARAVLRAYLDTHPVVVLWDEAIGDHRPLVCARRGATRVHYGLQYHSVVMKTSWLIEFALDPAVRQRHPEFVSLPAGAVLTRALGELPGVTPVRHATPLSEEGEAGHRLSGWVRLDPKVWPLKVPELVERLIADPLEIR